MAGTWPEALEPACPEHSGEEAARAPRRLARRPDPAARRADIPLVAGAAALADLCRAEAQPSVRVPLLLALGDAAAAAGRAAPSRAEHEAYEATRAVLAAALEDGHPAVKVAAVHACALLDPDPPVRHVGLLVEAFSCAGALTAFEEAWYVPGEDEPWSREPVVAGTAGLFAGAPEAEASFAAGLVDAARRTGDTALCRAALDVAWRLLVRRPSSEPVLLPVAGALLAHPDGSVRLRAAHILAMLGPRAMPCADRLAALLDDPGEDEFIDGTVGEYARWALARIGDARALPDLVDRLYQPYREGYSGGWIVGEPRRPDIDDVLVPLRDHADALMPALLKAMRHDAAHNGGSGLLTRSFLRVLEAWGEKSLPALPDVVALLDDTCYALDAAGVLAAMGRAAASAEPALRRCSILDAPANHCTVAWAAWRIMNLRPELVPPPVSGQRLDETAREIDRMADLATTSPADAGEALTYRRIAL
ncbi:HEAT repeat domain-containing protein [Streptomyces roseoverticillatus]|uniref:HEAT repeat domain-containing protein n=1 Tax=Streptomyces roseoverticillatus TaxID=66429 RepID=UPI0033E44CC8